MARAKKTRRGRVQLDDMPGQSDPSALIDGAQLLAAARPVLDELRADLAERANKSAALTAALRARYEDEKKAKRTADGFAAWVDSRVAQVAASWFLSCVFVRTLEDRGLLGQNRLAGPGATDSQSLFFELGPSLTERDYLLFVFRELSELPAAAGLFDREHALVWQLSPSAEAAKKLLRLFRLPRADEPAFRFGQGSTRFLGDLYQDLYEDVRKRYALLQTPDFVESFILDRTLEPAIDRFGLGDTTIIDPTCGSGHFLLGAFERLFQHRLAAEPGLDVASAAKQALDAVYGADINPYAVAIAKFRLTLAYLEKAGTAKLAAAPELPLHVVVADSLLHNPHKPQTELEHVAGQSTEAWRSSDAFRLEDEVASRDILHRQFAAVVGNPPYITVKDKALRDQYRAMYPRSAFREYSLAAPFCERFFQLARKTGYVGQITANSFMKREFGKKLIEDYLPSVNLELVVNTSGAYIPGHGTPTVLLFGTHEDPIDSEVMTVLAKRDEPSTPAEPSKGEVWSSIVDHWSELDFDNDWISVAKTKRDKLAQHPWSLAGGGATDLKALLEERAHVQLGEVVDAIGFSVITGEDNCLSGPKAALVRNGVPAEQTRRLVRGEEVRDWTFGEGDHAVWPNDDNGIRLNEAETSALRKWLWPYRQILRARKAFGVPVEQKGIPWWALREVYSARMRTPFTIAFAFVATHNHFVLDRGGKVFNRTAPIIKLPATATEDDHLALLAYLNSSAACFWMKQVFMNKGGSGIGRGIQDEAWEARYEFDGTKLKSLPIPPRLSSLVGLGRRADALARAEDLDEAERFERLVAVQEQIDWAVYELFGLSGRPDLPDATSPGHRPFEWRLLQENPSTAWFERNRYPRPDASTTPAPAAALEQIASSDELQLLERPDFKHRWTVRDMHAKGGKAADEASLGAIEDSLSNATVPQKITDRSNADLVKASAVPFLAALRYTEAGLKKHAAWQQVWAQQRAEDAGEPVQVAVPPKYAKTDFASPEAWSLRGKLDVPKERFISYPGCESDEDREPVYGWAGWNHLQRAQALANLYQKRKTEEGWPTPRLIPMLAGLQELIPWLRQYHNTPDPAFNGLRMANYFQDFLTAECTHHSLTPADLTSWRPPAKMWKA